MLDAIKLTFGKTDGVVVFPVILSYRKNKKLALINQDELRSADFSTVKQNYTFAAIAGGSG
jgi:hypothetical protein